MQNKLNILEVIVAVMEDQHIEKQNCTGQKCQDCRLCYSFNDVYTIVEKVKRY